MWGSLGSFISWISSFHKRLILRLFDIMKLTNLSFHRRGWGGDEEFNLIHKSHSGLQALAHQFDKYNGRRRPTNFINPMTFRHFMGGGGKTLKALHTHFITYIILTNCKLHLGDIMNFILSREHEALTQHFHHFTQILIPVRKDRGGGEFSSSRHIQQKYIVISS